MTTSLSIALGEYDTGWHDPRASLASAMRVVRSAADAGADVVALPEMATTGFTMDKTHAVSIDAPPVVELRRIARECATWVIAGVALLDEGDASRAVNASVVIDPTGAIAAVHRKQRLFAIGEEDRHYTPGTESTIVAIGGARLGLLICYELRFHELFAPLAADVEGIVLIANWPRSRQAHWEALLRARAIDNQCYIIGVNRTGAANGLEYAGGSLAFDPWGESVVERAANGTLIAALDVQRVARVRAKYPFLKDRCLESDRALR